MPSKRGCGHPPSQDAVDGCRYALSEIGVNEL